MPYFFDGDQIRSALQNQAIPALEAIAANDGLRNRSLRRFERDDPPPYESSTDSEEFEDVFFAPPRTDSLPQEVVAILERPLDDVELNRIARNLRVILYPSYSYLTDAREEEYRLDTHRGNKNMIFRSRKGLQRLGVVVRHNVKRRWEKLGIWNPEWGFPGRNVQANDRLSAWNWRWEQRDAGSSGSGGLEPTDMEGLVWRALRLRQNLRRGESAPLPPRSHLKQGATASEAESFIISRPWFVFALEVAEERTRFWRVDLTGRQRTTYSPQMQVIEWWKERGDWREEFNREDWVHSWKWRHESPSPEPEDLTPLDKVKESPLEATEMDFTPSEIDDLETVELPSHEKPENFWTMPDEDELRGTYPGEFMDLERKARKELLRRAAEEDQRRGGPAPPRPYDKFDIFQPLPAENESLNLGLNGVTAVTQEEKASTRQQGTKSSLPQKATRKPVCQQLDEGDAAQHVNPPPVLRRSARIAGMKRSAEDLPSQLMPNKRPKNRAASKDRSPMAQPHSREIQHPKERTAQTRPSPKVMTAPHPREERRRGLRSAKVRNKSIAAPVPAGIRKTRVPAKDRQTASKGRGRRRKIK